jgi:hypothetical protein
MSLAPAYEEQAVQAFPISSNLFTGIASDETCANRSVLHAVEDGDITFTFRDSTTKVLSVIAGMDLGLTRDVISVTSTANIWLG